MNKNSKSTSVTVSAPRGRTVVGKPVYIDNGTGSPVNAWQVLNGGKYIDQTLVQRAMIALGIRR